ncbi:polysaccharide biosynthesis/export family protein [Deminuibacter soli]|uniref:Uncharacterized protein n=1 Tax=Deminuibacter soli TaxID=2291815 RepID=A0A3E1NHS5_9BACT|nr:polysaccharide biosynthesis/export family protein [Deminuibacter soli]RFM27404.1 hypothetical protein DXN05_15405 [Deminuibacter soli]
MRIFSGKIPLQFILLGIVISSLSVACSTNKKIAYFQDVPDSLYLKVHENQVKKFVDPVIQSNDILQVTILTLDPGENSVLSNTNSAAFPVQPSSGGGASLPVNGFMVDRDGLIELPIVGKIKVSGLTTAAARDTIHNIVAKYYKTPVVNVRFTNFSVSVLGEVQRPGTYTVPNEKVSVLDAISMAGDLSIFGRRENVMVIRDSLGSKKVVRLDLNNLSQTVQSPYFYLSQGDMVYVEPNKAKIASTDAYRARNLTIAVSVISLLIIIISRL